MKITTVLGYASLLSKRSIMRHFRNAENIRPVLIRNHARCFNSYGTLSVKRGLAAPTSHYLSHASAILKPGSDLLALAFDLNDDDYRSYERHEFRYSLKPVSVTSLRGDKAFEAILCFENVDHEIDASLVGKTSLLDLYDDYDVSSFWHTDHLPAEHYLEHCLAAAHKLGGNFLDNFLDESLLSDRRTTIRSFLKKAGKDPISYACRCRLSEIF